MRRLLRTLLLVATAALVAACGAARPSKYYALDLPPAPPATANTHDAALLVGRLSAPHLYRDDRIVYRTGETQIGTYEYHRWAEPPTDMLESMLLRLLRGSGKYRTVQRLASNTQGDYIVRGRLHVDARRARVPVHDLEDAPVAAIRHVRIVDVALLLVVPVDHVDRSVLVVLEVDDL